jgi:glycosyltransferase involved in cell wall biosynthesis
VKELQVLITTFNEERNLPDCLRSVEFAGKILIVDSFSTDGTPEIAAAAGAECVQREYHSPADQKNWALEQLESGWVLILDADERVSPALREEIGRVLAAPEHEAYWIPRKTWFLGKEILHAGWNRDGVIRLLMRDAGRYEEALVHERMRCGGTVGKLTEYLEHMSYHSLDDYMERMLRYSLSGGRELHRRGRRAAAHRAGTRPLLRFLRMYVLQRGFLDGAHGLLLCMLSSLQVGLKHAIHWAHARGLVKDHD